MVSLFYHPSILFFCLLLVTPFFWLFCGFFSSSSFPCCNTICLASDKCQGNNSQTSTRCIHFGAAGGQGRSDHRQSQYQKWRTHTTLFPRRRRHKETKCGRNKQQSSATRNRHFRSWGGGVITEPLYNIDTTNNPAVASHPIVEENWKACVSYWLKGVTLILCALFTMWQCLEISAKTKQLL